MEAPVTHDPHVVLPSTLAFSKKNHGSLWETGGKLRGNLKKIQKKSKKLGGKLGTLGLAQGSPGRAELGPILFFGIIRVQWCHPCQQLTARWGVTSLRTL